MSDRIPTERVQKYAAVSGMEDDSGLSDGELADTSNHVGISPSDEELSDDGGELGRLNTTKRQRPLRRLRSPPSMNQGGSVVLGNAKILLFFSYPANFCAVVVSKKISFFQKSLEKK